MEKREVRKVKPIQMHEFLSNYYCLTNENLIRTFCKLSHKDMSKVAKDFGIIFERCNSQNVTQEDLKTGLIIFVKDHFNNPAPYINPLKSMYFEDEILEEYSESFKEEKRRVKRRRENYDRH